MSQKPTSTESKTKDSPLTTHNNQNEVSPLGIAFNSIPNFMFPITMAMFAYYGSSVLTNALPSIPFLLPSAVLLAIMCVRSFPRLVRGPTKTLLALFFLFSGIQNVAYFQMHHIFFSQNGTNDKHSASPSFSAFPLAFTAPEDFLHIPQFIAIAKPGRVCVKTASEVSKKYSTAIAESKSMADLSQKLAVISVDDIVIDRALDVDCVDIVPLITIDRFLTVGISPQNAIYKVPTPISPQASKKPEAAPLPTNSIQLMRAYYLLSEHSIIPLPPFVAKFIRNIFDVPSTADDVIPADVSATVLSAKENNSSNNAAAAAALFERPFGRLYKSATTLQFWLCIGLVFCFIGDIFLIFGTVDVFFVVGLFAFLLGHVFFLVAFVYQLASIHIQSVPTFVIQGIFFGTFWLIFDVKVYAWAKRGGKLKFPINVAIILYVTVICFMVMASWLLAIALPQSRASNISHSVAAAATRYPSSITPSFANNNVKMPTIEFIPIASDAVLHVVNIALRLPMYISADLAYKFGMTDCQPRDIADHQLFSHHVVAGESWCYLFAALGATLFLFSDLFVAREKFVVSCNWNTYIGLPMYFIAQLLIANVMKYQ